MLLQHVRCVKVAKSTRVNVSNAHPRRFTQGRQAQIILRLTALNQPQAFAQNFAGILVAPGVYKLLN